MTHDQPPRRVWGRRNRATRGRSARTGGGTAASRAMDASNPTYIFTKRRVGCRTAEEQEPRPSD